MWLSASTFQPTPSRIFEFRYNDFTNLFFLFPVGFPFSRASSQNWRKCLNSHVSNSHKTPMQISNLEDDVLGIRAPQKKGKTD